MRYRLMATYHGVSYEAGVGPTDKDIVLFAACPPPEELAFHPATGHWRKAVSRAEVDEVWESRPSGVFAGEPCLVLDDLGEHLHLSYLGHDQARAERIGYVEVEPGVLELLAAREDVTMITEDRVDHPFLAWQGWLPAPEPETVAAEPGPGLMAEPGVMAEPGPGLMAGPGVMAEPRVMAEPGVAAEPGAVPEAALFPAAPPLADGIIPRQDRRQGRAAGRSARALTRQVFAELVDLAAMRQDAYAVDEVVDGAICLVSTESGFEVFTAADGVRQEVRAFRDEEAAYFYLFGLLAAEAVRDGRLVPPG